MTVRKRVLGLAGHVLIVVKILVGAQRVALQRRCYRGTHPRNEKRILAICLPR